MAVSWSSGVLNKYVAPGGLTDFTEAEIPDLRSEFEQASHWLANHFLNTVLRATYPDRFRQVALGFLRRVYHGFRAYHIARDLTLDHLGKAQPHNPSVTAYYSALEQWEVFALHVSMATDLFRWLNEGEGAFQKNDGSPEQRLYTIANHTKHLQSCVDSGQCTETDTVPLWLSNEGLNSFDVAVSYSEVGQILRDLSSLADQLQDPLTFAGRKSEPDES